MNTDNVLFMDDDAKRIRHFRSIAPHSIICTTVASTIDFLGNGRAWDVVCLDHDMEGYPYQDPEEETAGMEVIRFLERCEEKPSVGLFVIHTLNETIYDEMMGRLSAMDYAVVRIPFGRRAKACTNILEFLNG